jgi:hypothetical protein
MQAWCCLKHACVLQPNRYANIRTAGITWRLCHTCVHLLKTMQDQEATAYWVRDIA